MNVLIYNLLHLLCVCCNAVRFDEVAILYLNNSGVSGIGAEVEVGTGEGLKIEADHLFVGDKEREIDTRTLKSPDEGEPEGTTLINLVVCIN